MIKLLCFITFLTPNIFSSLSEGSKKTADLLDERLSDAQEVAKRFYIVDDRGIRIDEPSSALQATLLQRFTASAAYATSSSLSTLHLIAARCGLTSQVSRFYNMPEAELVSFIQSKATTANPYQGYREIETAILKAIEDGNKEDAILLFNKISSKKVYFTPAALETISKATQEYQTDIDYEFLQSLLLYQIKTARNAHMFAESKKITGASSFQRQEGDAVSFFAKQKLDEIRTFASQNLHKLQHQHNDDDDD